MNKKEFEKMTKRGEGEKPSPSSAYQEYAKIRMQSALSDYGTGMQAMGDIYSGWQSPEELERRKSVAMDASRKMMTARNTYGIDTYDDAISMYNKSLAGIDDIAKGYAYYKNGDAYRKAQKNYEFSQKYNGYSYDDIQKALSSVEDQDEADFLKGYTKFSSLEDFDQALASASGDYKKGLKREREAYEKAHRFDKYADIRNNADFGEVLPGAMNELRSYEMGVATDPMRALTRGNIAFADSLDDDKYEIAAYIFKTQGEKAYKDFMKDMTFEARQNEAAEIRSELNAAAENNPVASTVINTLASPIFGLMGGIEQIGATISGSEDPTISSLLTKGMSEANSVVAQNIKEEAGWLPSFAYEVFTTGVPNRVGQMLYGKAYTAVMGMSSFATTYADEIANGADTTSALWKAFASGAIEILTELIPWDLAFGNGKTWYTTMAKQMFFEGSEEAIGALANLTYDTLANGGYSEFQQKVQRYVEQGYERSQAESMAWKDFAIDTAKQFAIAALSVAPTTGTASITQAVQESSAGQFVNREMLGEINNADLKKKYGDEWTQKASNREVYKAYSDYVGNLQNESAEAEKKATAQAIAQEYKISEEEATKWAEALYNGDKKMLKTHFGQALTEDVNNREGWTKAIDTTETTKIASKLNKAFSMIKTKDQVSAEKASKAIKTGEKNTVNGKEAQIISMTENKDGSYTVKTSEGEVNAKDVTVTEQKATALTYSANIENEAFKEAYVRYYAGEDIADYDTYARYLYNAGRQGIDYSDKTNILDTLGVAKAQAIYNVGALEALQEEIEDARLVDEVTKKYAEKFRPGTFKAGEYSNGKFKENKDFFRNLNRTQKRLYKIVESFSKLSGVNVRMYLDRDAASENGQFIAGKNGGTIYINLAARPFADNAYGINQYVISTLSHELTHWLKANNREAYDILEEAVKKDLQKNNTFEKRLSTERETLLKTHENELKESGKSEEEIKAEMEKYSKKKDLDEIALEEVVARACEDMLNDADTMQEVLSFADQDGLTKLQSALKKWFDHIRGFFRDLMGGFHAPNNVVADLQKSYDHLRELWVNGMKEAIAQNRREQKTTENKKAASVKNSVKQIIGNDGTNYGMGVYLDSTLLTNLTDDERKEMVKERIKELGGQVITAFDKNGNKVDVKIMKPSLYFYNENGKRRSADHDLISKKINNKTKQEAVVLIDELISTANHEKTESAKHKHGWIDNNGKNDWEVWKTYVQDKNNDVYEAFLKISNTKNGEKVIYDVEPIKKMNGAGKSATHSSNAIILQNNKQSNNKSVKLSSREKQALDTLDVEIEGSYAYPKFNLKTYRESDYNKNIDVAAKALAKQMEISEAEAKKYIKDVGSIANIIANDQERLDYIAIEGKSAWVSNPEYGGSLDYSFLCPKRLTYTGTMNAILKKQNDLIFSVDDFLWLRKALITAGYEAPCSYCFVESARARFGKYNQQFLDIAKEENLAYIPTAEELTNPDKLEELREKHPETYKRYEKFLNTLSQRKPKMLEERRAYDGDILKEFMGKEDTIAYKNLHGGIRFNSFSDFETVHMLDCMQAIMDMSRVGLAGFGYTKQKAFAKIFGKTGLKINMSCVAKGIEADGQHIIFDDVEGMNHEEALKLRNGNVGIVCVVFNDAQMRAALCDERIDYILPFHRSQWSKKDYEKMGLSLETKDYTKPQTEKLGTKKAKEGNIPFLTYWNESQTGKETVQRYLDLINEQGKTPIFPMVLEKVDGKWIMPKGIKKNGKFINKTEAIKEKAGENYWKLLTEFKLYDNDGKPIGQEAVKPNFDMKAARELLKEYDGSHKEFPVAQDVVDSFVEYKKTGKSPFEWTRSSVKMDSQGNTLTKGQQNYFKNSKVRDEQGRLKVMYHGTTNANFSVFNTAFSDDNISFFFTDNIGVATSYSNTQNRVDVNNIRKNKGVKSLTDLQEFLKEFNLSAKKDGSEIVIERNDDGEIIEYVRADSVEEAYDNWIYNYAEGEDNIFGGVYEVYLNAKNPLVIKDEGYRGAYFSWDNLEFTPIDEKLQMELNKAWHTWNDLDNRKRRGESIDLGEYDNARELLERLESEKEKYPILNTTREAAQYAKDHGYDSVIIENVSDTGSYGKNDLETSTVVIVFDSNQIKSIHNENPTNDADIRKSTKMDSEGKTLTEDQVRFFENSKARDEHGNLMVMYHGSRGAGFTVFNPKNSDDGRSLFFTNRLDVASGYTATSELFEPDRPMSFKELSEKIQSFTHGEQNLIKDGNDYVITEEGLIGEEPHEIFRGTLKKAQEFFIDSIEDLVNENSAVYKVYLNLENPLVIDAKGNYWNELPLPEDYDESFSDIDIYESGDGFEADWTENGESKHGQFASWDAVEKKFGSLYEKMQSGSIHIDDIYLGFDGNRIPTNTREYATYAQNHGYDGVIINNVIDQGLYSSDKFGQSTVMIAFEANQIKSVYNESPTKDKDIRKSVKLDSNGNTLTEGQQNYFKDSKVVDDQGRLLVVYHGTYEDFEAFKPNKFTTEKNGLSKIVGYFSEDKEYAKIYGDTKAYYLNIKNPLVMDGEAKTLKEWEKFFKANGVTNFEFDSSVTGKNGQADPLKGGRFEDGTYYAFYELLDSSEYWYGDGNLSERIQAAGYDGIQSNDEFEKAWMPFNAEAVKSVDNANPTDSESVLKSTKLPPEAQKLVDELTLENKRLTEENTALKMEKGIEKAKAEKQAIIDKITEQSQVLSRWLLTNDKTNPVPQAIKEPLGKLLTSISFTKDDYEWRKSKGNLTKSEETLGQRMAKISQLLLEIEQDKAVDKDAYDLSQLDWIPEFTTEFAKIKDAVAAVEARQGENFNLSKMSTEDLQSLSNMITALKSAITNMNKCLSAHNKESVSGVGQEIISYLDSIGQKKFDNRATQFLEIDNTVPFYFFKRLGAGGQKAFKLLMDGMNQYAFEAKQIEDYAKEVFSGKDVNAWRQQVKTFEVDEIEYGTVKGEDLVQPRKKTIQMTVPQIMSLYCLSKRDQAVNHLKTGGIKIGDFKVKGAKETTRQIENVTLTKDSLDKIIASLDEEQKQVANKLQEFMNTVCQKWGNEVTMKRFGFKGMTEKNYFPIKVDQNQLSREARQRGTSLYQLLNMGFTKPINPKAKNPIEIFDIFEVFAMHSTEMAQYHSLALPVLDVIRIWNYKDLEMLDESEDKAHWHSVKASIENTLGAQGNRYIGLLLADMNGDVSGGRADDVVSVFLKNYKTAAVAANLQVAALQPLSYIRAGYMIDSKYLAKGMAMKSTKDALKWCGIAVWKEMGFYNTSIHRGLEHKIMQDESKKESIIDKSLYLAGKADEWTWSKLWNACLLETKDKYPNLEGDDLYRKTAERLTEVIYGTQVVDSILTRSQIMRDKTMYSKEITAFQSEPTLALNVLMDAAESFSMEARRSGTQAALKKYGDTLRRAALVYLIGSAVESLLRAVIGKIRKYDGDEDDESFIADFFGRFIEELNPLRKIPWVKDVVGIISSVVKVVSGKQYKLYTDTRMDEAIFEQIGKATVRIVNMFKGKDVSYKVAYEIAKGIDASGLPVSSTFRAFKVFWNNTVGRIWPGITLK